MELTLQEKLKLIEFFEFLLDKEISKPFGEMNSEAVDNYIKILLHLQDKHVDLSPEFINEQVRKIFHKEENTAIPEATKTTKKYFNKKKVWLVAACVAILVALFSIISVANDWNVFDFLSEKFGSVHSAPIEEEQDFNGTAVFMNGKNINYSTIEEAVKKEKINLLFPSLLPEELSIIDIMRYQTHHINQITYTFNDPTMTAEIYFNTPLDESIKTISTDIKQINSLTCYVCDMSDISRAQIYFEHEENVYMFSYTDKSTLFEIIQNLEEINYEN